MAMPVLSTYSVAASPIYGGLAGAVLSLALTSGDAVPATLSFGDAGPGMGSIVNAGQTNTLESLDPKNDPLANPNYPANPPWRYLSNWYSVTDYCGAVFAPTVGAQGTWMMYGSSGHAAIGATFWVGFDVATRTWQRIGPRPLPSNGLQGYVANVSPDPAAFDHTWGDYDGGYVGWPAGFRQPGRRVLEGSHTRSRMAYQPPDKAGNAKGRIFCMWRVTGVNDALNITASHYYDLDDHTWHRTTNIRPNWGAYAGAVVYHAGPNLLTCNSADIGGSSASHMDVLDCASMTWTRRTMTSGGRSYNPDTTGFGWVDGAGKSWHIHQSGIVDTHMMYAVCAEDLQSGAAVAWQDLTLSYTTLPANSAGDIMSQSWCWCPNDGRYYAVNRIGGSNKLWRMTPPISGVITGLWLIEELTVSGSLQASDWDHRRLQWAPAINALLWHGPDFTADMQIITPPGV